MDKQQKAFPRPPACAHDGGMDLRDYFAAAVITDVMPGNVCDFEHLINEAANNAYRIADAMMEARKE